MPPQLVHVYFPSIARPLIPALFQQAECIVPSLCSGSLYPIAISSWMLRRFLICSPPHWTRKECLLFLKKKAQGLWRPWRKQGTQTQSQVEPQSPACFFFNRNPRTALSSLEVSCLSLFTCLPVCGSLQAWRWKTSGSPGKPWSLFLGQEASLGILRGSKEETGTQGSNQLARGEKKLVGTFLSPGSIKTTLWGLGDMCDSHVTSLIFYFLSCET